MNTKPIIDAILAADTIIIHRHVNPDPDAYGSQGGLAHVLKHSFPEKKVLVVGEEVAGLRFLNKMDVVADDVFNDALVIVCDTGNTERISDQRYQTGASVVKIDHHPDKEPYGDISWVDTSFSSASEMIVQLVLNHGEVLRLDAQAARLLYAGIVGDTGRFLFPNTSKQTLAYAGLLLECGIDPQEIYTNLNARSRSQAKLNGRILSDFDVTPNGVAHYFVTSEILEQLGLAPDEASLLVNTMKDINGNEVWVLFVEYPERIRVNIRSKQTEIHVIARKWNGGGHPLASGATVHSKEEAEQLIQDLDDLLRADLLAAPK